ncbi:glycoprotein endo-alpha-1,2-mannosidase-like protein [Bacillus rossius redtenbacheri]|uniref:glycoprotein endo-alpha-1,2-mannosidase-like protein n=1 Tax=Bacillus rossius redtenbacheri TaxID=93214 RepID=UPI002FDD1DC6
MPALRRCYAPCRRRATLPVLAAAGAVSALALLVYTWAGCPDCAPSVARPEPRVLTSPGSRPPPRPPTERATDAPLAVNHNVHVFYYAWYGSVAVDGEWRHWDHPYLPNWRREDKRMYPTSAHEPPGDISSNYYPALGCYSSRDPAIIRAHMQQLKDSGVGTLVVSWYPPGMADPEGSPPDAVLPELLDAAHAHGLKVAVHVEPYRGRSPASLAEQVRYLVLQYGTHPALLRMARGPRSLPVLYVYDSYLLPAAAWRELLSPRGNLSLRGTPFDAVFLALLVDVRHKYEVKQAHFDGFYTYFASDGFTYGSTWKNWRGLGKFARQHDLLFVPSVGPGYVDTQVRPWNAGSTRHRQRGRYYGAAWRSALAARARIISITSFNEWHEGTQIEPAVPRPNYLDYEPEGALFYLNLTRSWVREFSRK